MDELAIKENQENTAGWPSRATAWIGRAKIGLIAPALIVGIPVLMGGVSGWGGALLTGKLNNLMMAAVSMDSSTQSNLNALNQAWEAPGDGSIAQATMEKARWIAGDFIKTIAPQGWDKKYLDIRIKYTGQSALNASMQSPLTGIGEHVLTVYTDAEGLWTKKASEVRLRLGSAADQAVASYTVGHEMGHTMFRPAAANLSSAEVVSALVQGGVDPKTAAALGPEAAKVPHKMPYGVSMLNEAFADCVSMAYMAKKLPRDQFEELFEGVAEERNKEFMRELKKMRVDANNVDASGNIGLSHEPDPHMTYPALLAMQLRGYDELRAMGPKEVMRAAMDSAHEGLLATVYMGQGGMTNLLKGLIKPEAVKVMEAAGKTIWLKNSHAWSKINSERKEQGFESLVVKSQEVYTKAGEEAFKEWMTQNPSRVQNPMDALPTPAHQMSNLKGKIAQSRDAKSKATEIQNPERVASGLPK